MISGLPRLPSFQAAENSFRSYAVALVLAVFLSYRCQWGFSHTQEVPDLNNVGYITLFFLESPKKNTSFANMFSQVNSWIIITYSNKYVYYIYIYRDSFIYSMFINIHPYCINMLEDGHQSGHRDLNGFNLIYTCWVIRMASALLPVAHEELRQAETRRWGMGSQLELLRVSQPDDGFFLHVFESFIVND